MLKKSLIGLGIGLGVLAVCTMLLVAGFMIGRTVSYVGARYVTREGWTGVQPQVPVPPETSPQPPEYWWQWSQSWTGPQQWPRSQWGSQWGFLSPVVVTEVTEDSPAEASGIEAGDIIIGIDGKALDANRHLAGVIHEHDPGEKTELTILRRGEETEILQVEITLGSDQDDEGEVVAYLGLWYRPFGSAMRFVPPASGAGD